MGNASMRYARKAKALKKKRQKIALGVIGLSVAAFIMSGIIYSSTNKDRNKLLSDSVETTCHITSVEEYPVTYESAGAILTVSKYRLVGTYETDDGLTVIKLNDVYENKSLANDQINTDRSIFVANDDIGVSGVFETDMIGLNKSFIAPSIIGIIILIAGLSIMFVPFENRKLAAPSESVVTAVE